MNLVIFKTGQRIQCTALDLLLSMKFWINDNCTHTSKHRPKFFRRILLPCRTINIPDLFSCKCKQQKKRWPVIIQFYQDLFKLREDMANAPSPQQHTSLWEGRNIRQNKNNNHFFWNSSFRQQVVSKLPSPTCKFQSSPTGLTNRLPI